MDYFESKKAHHKNKSGFISKILNIKGFIISSLVIGSIVGFLANHFWLDELVALGVVNSSKDLWVRVSIMVLLVIIPPYLMNKSDTDSKDN